MKLLSSSIEVLIQKIFLSFILKNYRFKKLPSLKILLEKLNFQLFSTLHYSNVMNITLESADRNVHMCNSYSKSIGGGYMSVF